MSHGPRSLRWRLQVWHGAWLAAVMAAFTATAFALVRESRFRRIDGELERRMAALSSLFRPAPRDPPRGPAARPGPGPRFGDRHADTSDGAGDRIRFPPGAPPRPMPGPADGPPPAGRPFPEWQSPPPASLEAMETSLFPTNETERFYYRVHGFDMTELRRSPGSPAGPPPPGPFDHTVRQTREFREHVRRHRGGSITLTVGKFIGPDLAELRRLGWILSGAAAAVWALGIAGGAWIAARAIRPIEVISATAQRIAAGDLGQRIPGADADTELGRLAGVLNSTFDRLCEAFARQTRFTADASHELRTPVSVILAQTESILARERPAAEYREALDACRRAAQRLRHLVESLLTLARLDAGAPAGEPTPVALDHIAADAIDLLRPLAAERGLRMDARLESARCDGWPEQLSQVAVNLISNAIHHNRPGGEVTIRTWTDGAACLSVRDTGVGISPVDLPRIFERFYRASPSRGSDGRAGLGLAIARAIVDSHGGRIDVVSDVGVGSEFIVRIPAVGAAGTGAPDLRLAPGGGDSDTPTDTQTESIA